MAGQDGTSTAPGSSRGTVERRGDLFDPACPTRRLLDRVGTKWTVMAVLVLDAAAAPLRFSEVRRRMPGVTQKMLTQTLRGLERDGLVDRRVRATSPPQVSYRLTGPGRSLVSPLSALKGWAESHMAEVDDHGTAWDARLVEHADDAG